MTALPQPEGDGADERRKERDVQAGNADQVADAGAVEQLPLLGRNGALIADRKGGEHARVRAVAKYAENVVAYGFARALNVVVGSSDKSIEASIGVVLMDVSGGAQ